MDPMKLSLEELVYLRLGQFLDQLHGRKVPDLYKVLMAQVDRAVLRLAFERNSGQVSIAAEFLGLDRNTVAKKAKRLKVAGARPSARR
jgi:Fis family transcriptional regulator, factor for inversion stimulation protein